MVKSGLKVDLDNITIEYLNNGGNKMEIIKNGFKNERLEIELNVYLIQGREWFRAKDISDFLGYQDTNKMMRSIETTKFNCIRQTLSGANNNKYEADFINESALYEIIFSITRRDMERYNKAREFQKWVFEEVLPSIRKNNFYIDKDNINKEQANKAVEYLLDLCDCGKISLGRASLKIFEDKSELKTRLINLGLIDFENCKFK